MSESAKNATIEPIRGQEEFADRVESARGVNSGRSVNSARNGAGSAATVTNVELFEPRDDYDSADDYRALSAAAVSTFALGILSPLAFLDTWLCVVPVAALMLGVIALRQLKRRSEEYTGKRLAVAGLVLALLFLISGGVFQGYVYANELRPGEVRASYAELQPYEGEPVDRIPPEAIALNGKKVLFKGYVFPGQRQNGITKFLLVRDQGDCCFGGNPKVTDRILVSLKDTKGFEFSGKLFKVAGEFHISPPVKALDAEGAVFYHLVDAELR